MIINNGMNAIRYRGLNRTASDNSFLTRTSPSRSCDSTWASTNSCGYKNDKEFPVKTRFLSTVDVQHTHNNNLSNRQTYKTERDRRHSSNKKKASESPWRNINSWGPHTTEHITISQLEEPLMYKPVPHSGELLLDFASDDDHSSQSYIVKRPDKIIELNGYQHLHHSTSMPGLIDSSVKENRSDSACAKFESKSRPFFHFFRKKNKASDGKSPSPSDKLNHQNIRRCPSNLSFTPQSRTVSQRTASPPSRGLRSVGQSPACSRFYLNSVSSNIPCTPGSPPSMRSKTETTSNSPTSIKQFPGYKPRSRSKLRRESRRTTVVCEHVHEDDCQTLEDLPPHPSLLKDPLGKTNSYPCTSAIKSRSIKITTSINNTSHRFEAVSAIRRNSLPESHTNLKMEDLSSEQRYSPKDFKVGSNQNLRNNSIESSNTSTSGTNSHSETTCSSHDQKPRPVVRSQSVPSFRADYTLPGTDTRVISDAEDFEYNPTNMTGPLHLSLCGCGFLGMYHLGVISCLTQRSPSLLERVEKVAGASAGAIMAALLISRRDKVEESAEHIQNLAKELRKKPLGPLTPGFNFTYSLRCMLDEILPENAHEISQGKLFVSVTNSDTKKNEMLCDFLSRDELIEAIVSSCYVTAYAGFKPASIRGKKYIDGGLSNNMPIFETGRTITVSPLDGKSDIGPKAGHEVEKKGPFLNVQNQDIQVSVINARKITQSFFPPKRQALEEYFEKGRYDASRFLIREGLYEISAISHRKVTLYESSV